MNEKIITEVHRKKKAGSGLLKGVMGFFAVLFLFMGIAFSTGYMLFCFIFALMYLIYDARATKDYEYVYEDGKLEIYVIHGKRSRRCAHIIDMGEVEVIAPHDAPEVDRYRKNGGTEHLRKYDYTSYDDAIPYYTMIAIEDKKKIKILLDLDDRMLAAMKYGHPEKVIRG